MATAEDKRRAWWRQQLAASEAHFEGELMAIRRELAELDKRVHRLRLATCPAYRAQCQAAEAEEMRRVFGPDIVLLDRVMRRAVRALVRG